MPDENIIIGLYAYPTDDMTGTFMNSNSIEKLVFMHGKSKSGFAVQPSSQTIVVLSSAIPTLWRYSLRALDVIEPMIEKCDRFKLYCPSVFEPNEHRRELSKVGLNIFTRHKQKGQVVFYTIEGLLPKIGDRIHIPLELELIRKEIADKKYGRVDKIPFRQFEEYYELKKEDF